MRSRSCAFHAAYHDLANAVAAASVSIVRTNPKADFKPCVGLGGRAQPRARPRAKRRGARRDSHGRAVSADGVSDRPLLGGQGAEPPVPRLWQNGSRAKRWDPVLSVFFLVAALLAVADDEA